jgi:hypothetical protein
MLAASIPQPAVPEPMLPFEQKAGSILFSVIKHMAAPAD